MLWWCVVVVCCGGACVWCVVKLGTHSLSLLFSLLPLLFPFFFSLLSFFFFFFFSCSFSYSCSCSCSFSFSFSFSSFFFLPFYTLFSSLPFTPTNTVQSTDQAHGTFIATANELHGMFPPLLLPPLLSSLLPPSHTQKKERGLLLQEYFRRGIYFYYSFKLIPKNRRRVKLQALQF